MQKKRTNSTKLLHFVNRNRKIELEPDKYGISNAITQAAQKAETWEKRIELEKLGGRLVSLPIEGFKSLDG